MRVNILFVNHNGVSSNSATHIINLAIELNRIGTSVALAVPYKENKPVGPSFSIPSMTFEEAKRWRFPNGRGADLVHAWTPRQIVSAATRMLCGTNNCYYVVHLEDNEYAVTAAFMGLTTGELISKSSSVNELHVPYHCAHPREMRTFLGDAIGITALVDSLLDFKPSGMLGVEIWPAAEDDIFYPQAPDPVLRASLGISDNAKVVVYHGNVHRANLAEMRSLYLAIAALCRSGFEIVLVRLGDDHVVVAPPEWPPGILKIIHVPFQHRREVPRYLALADILVQPGRCDEFNDYRFPSKLPEFFAMGIPVVLPATNIGRQIKHGNDALLLFRGDAIEIAAAMYQVLRDSNLHSKLSTGARSFYNRMFGWKNSSEKLNQFYIDALNANKWPHL